MLHPTVLWTKDGRSRAFGLELPFPFVTVAEARDDAHALALARDSLIVSADRVPEPLLDAFCADPSILKVFDTPHAERGYRPGDPHEGYLADFLYQKKAIYRLLSEV